MNQSMEHDEILNVRWATEDPNEGIRAAEALRVKALGVDTVAQNMPKAFRDAILSVDDLEAQEADNQEDDDQPAAKRPRLINGENGKPAEIVEMTADDVEWQLQAIQDEQSRLTLEEMDYNAEVERQRLEQDEYVQRQKEGIFQTSSHFREGESSKLAASMSIATPTALGLLDYGSDSE